MHRFDTEYNEFSSNVLGNSPLIRIHIHSKSMRSLLTKLFEHWPHCISVISSLAISDDSKELDLCNVLLFCHDVDRPIDLNGQAYSPLLDSVREDFELRGLSCRSVAHRGSLLTGKKAYGEPVSLNRAHIWCRLKKKAINLLGMTARFENEPFASVLERTGAQLVVTIGSPTELASAARSKGVFHVELLHGIGYTFLPWGWNELSSRQLPQGILSLDQVSTESCAPLVAKGIEIHTIPHPFLKSFVSDKSESQPADWEFQINSENGYLKHILVSLNWAYSGDHGPHIQFANIIDNGLFFDEIGDLVKEDSNIFWHFRLHPVQLRNPRYENLLKFMDDFVSLHSNSEWKEASGVPFPSVARHCDGNIGMSSMSCYDAAAMGVPSLMLCPTVQKGGIHQDRFSDLENEGYVTKIQVDKERIRNWVHQTHKMKSRLSNLDDDGAWEDAVEWMLRKSGLDECIKHRASI